MPKHKKQNKKQKQKKFEKQQQRANKNNKNNNQNNNNKINNQNKYQKKKERNAYRKKKNRKKDEIDEEFIKDLEKLGYFIREVGGDGNCLFRSVSDQIDNNQNNYKLYREMCINYMKENKDEFIPFIEDDEPYDKYISRMEEDGEWGGNLEIYALSKVLNANFYIYIHKHPMYIVNNFEKPKKNILLTYHEGKHYNSLRKLEEKNKEDKEKEDDDDNNDINNLINQVEHLNI